MELVARSIMLSCLSGISCQVFFETFAGKRKWKHQWMEHMTVPVFTAGFLLIAVTPIPPFLLQPVRLVLVVVAAAALCFQITVLKNLIISALFCCTYWIISIICLSALYAFPFSVPESVFSMLEFVVGGMHLGLAALIRRRFRRPFQAWSEGKGRLGWICIPLLSMVVIMAIAVMPWDGTAVENRVRMAMVFGFALINLYAFYVMGRLMEKEEEMHRMELLYARRKNQMSMYETMKKSYEKQRRYLHDYKNQLNCIHGMIDRGQKEEALAYIAGLTGGLAKNTDYVNTNHSVVNVVLNQKYREACEKGITMTVVINDLSGITMSEEEVVTLLVNLLDNGIEACEKLEQNKVLQFKMILEEGQLILSVRNPVKEPVLIKDNLVATSKRDASSHGIGLVNVNAVIQGNGGSSVIRCENGWFCFYAMIPL